MKSRTRSIFYWHHDHDASYSDKLDGLLPAFELGTEVEVATSFVETDLARVLFVRETVSFLLTTFFSKKRKEETLNVQ